MNKKILILLALFTFLSLFLHIYKIRTVPPCLNADEAAFGYNAYSILKTGKDEYGAFLPLRLKSFGDYKLPLYSYLSIPFIAVLGLSEFSMRLLANLIGIFFPILLFLTVNELFQNKKIALLSAFLISVSPWLQITSRHAHETTLAALTITLSVLFFARFLKKQSLKNFLIFSLFNVLSLFSYHTARIFAIYFFFCLIFILFKNKVFIKIKKRYLLLIFLIPIFVFLYSEIKYPAVRVNNLIFFRNLGFSLKINELRGEHNLRILHNKLTESVLHLSKEYLKYFSPQFLSIYGDLNPRFGYDGISPITVVEYIFIFIGLYYLFKNKEKYRFFILFLLLISPSTASLSWQDYSLTRSFYLIIPLILITSYGFINFLYKIKDLKQKKFIITIFSLLFIFFLINTWDFYFFHYPKRAQTIEAWQCGYKELTSYIERNYHKFKEFKITIRHGQPYIFLLFYLKYPPEEYQKQAKLSLPDQYGFGQIEKFDKFNFNFSLNLEKKGVSYIGYPEHFINDKQINKTKIKKLKFGAEEIFWIYEN